MGVDYSSNFGIGVKLDFIEDEDLEAKGFNDMYEYAESLGDTQEVSLKYFTSGNAYTGSEMDFYLCLRNPSLVDLDAFKARVDAFKAYLAKQKVAYSGEVDLVGGLQIS